MSALATTTQDAAHLNAILADLAQALQDESLGADALRLILPVVERPFILAGKAIFTVSNPSGERYTFRVRRVENDDRPAVYFVSLLTGPMNTSDYTYLGLLNPATGEVRLTAKSRMTDDSTPVKVIRWALRRIWAGASFPQGYHAHHAGRCGRCGRLLTVPESILSGLGPECAGRLRS